MFATIAAYATPGHILMWFIPVFGVLGLLTWLYLTIASSSRKIHPERRNDQQNHRGMEQGGTYTYRPGMFSHSYPPEKSTQFDEFRRDNPQPGREPRVPPEERVYEERPTAAARPAETTATETTATETAPPRRRRGRRG